MWERRHTWVEHSKRKSWGWSNMFLAPPANRILSAKAKNKNTRVQIENFRRRYRVATLLARNTLSMLQPAFHPWPFFGLAELPSMLRSGPQLHGILAETAAISRCDLELTNVYLVGWRLIVLGMPFTPQSLNSNSIIFEPRALRPGVEYIATNSFLRRRSDQ